MPRLATAEFFRQRKLVPGEILAPPEQGGLKGIIPVAGLMPVLVPSMVDAGLVALREYGTKSFADVIAPAIELADGMPIDEMRAGSIERGRRFFDMWPSSKDRKSTRLNSSHSQISYAVFCLKKKKNSTKSTCTNSRLTVNAC